MNTRIEPIIRKKIIDYGNELLSNFWKIKPDTITSQDHQNQLNNFLQSVEKGFVCIQTESLTDESLIKLIFEIANNLKVRFYILVNEYSQELNSLNEICLIRYGVQNKGTFLLVNPNSDKPKGIFFTGRLTKKSLAVSGHISMSLDSKKVEELFRYFCYNFWELASKEILIKDKHTNVTSKPLDVFHDPKQFGDKDFVYGTLFDFVEEAKRNDLSKQKILYLNQENQIPTLIEEISYQSLGENPSSILLPKEEFENFEPNLPDDNVSVKIEYEWKNIPLYLPQNAKEHSLYQNWKSEQEKLLSRLNQIQKEVEEMEKKENSISKKIVRFFLGKKNICQGFKNVLEDLKGKDFANLTESELKEVIKRINEINLKVQCEDKEIEKEDRKAKIDEQITEIEQKIEEKKIEKKEKESEKEEKEKKIAEIENQKSEVNSLIKKEEEKLKSVKERYENLRNELKKEIEIAKQETQKIKNEKLTTFCDGNKHELNKIKSELERKAGKKNNNQQEREEAQKKLKELEDIQNFKSEEELKISEKEKELKNKESEENNKINEEIKTLKKQVSEYDNEIKNVFLQKTIDEISKIEKEISNLKQQIESKRKDKDKVEKDAKEKIEELSSLESLLSGKDIQQPKELKSQAIAVPQLPQLPQIGKLYQAGSQSYLVIEYWEEFEKGKLEAERLKAILCTTKI